MTLTLTKGPRVWGKNGEAHNPTHVKSSVNFPQLVISWSAMSSTGVGLLCSIKSKVNAAVYQEIYELPSADKIYRDGNLLFHQDLAQCRNYY